MENLKKIALIIALGGFAYFYLTRKNTIAISAPPNNASFAPWYTNYNYPVGMTGNAMADLPPETIGFDGIATNDNTCSICSLFFNATKQL